MPLVFTRNSDRPRASDRTMVDTEDTRTRLPSFQTRLALSPSADELHRDEKQTEHKLSSESGGTLTAVGWISRQNLLVLRSRRSFFLDISFIELIDSRE